MKHTLNLVATLFAILLLAGHCKKAETSLEGDKTSFSVTGRIVDNDNLPVSNALVSAGSVTATTDLNGHFTLSNVRMPRDAAYVKAEKAGYFTGSRTFVANTGTTNHVQIALIEKDNPVTFASSAGGTVNLPGGSSVQFQANTFVDAGTKNPYSGNVTVSAFFIDPTAPNFASIMPGDLRGINASNQERGLESFGMLAVDITGGANQKLQLNTGKTALLTFAIPAALVSQAPATIPLWYFDESTGFWKEEGAAVKQGSVYVGTVSHFSFWNCDAPFELVDFSALLHNQSGQPLAGAHVKIVRPDGSSGYSMSDAGGNVRGKIPANEALTMIVKDRCNNQVYSGNIGPFSSTANIGTVVTTASAGNNVTITGTVVNCNATAVTNGYVNVELEGINYRTPISNGNFSLTVQRCENNSATAQLYAMDATANQLGAVSTISVTTGTANAGQLTACGITVSQYINYSINGKSYALTVPPDSLEVYATSQTHIGGRTMGSSNYQYFGLSFTSSTPGTYPINELHIFVDNTAFVKQGAMNVNVTEYGTAPNTFIGGNFTGNVKDSLGTAVYPINGTFRVKRYF